ncbi:hypothetical protein ACTPEF_25810 [Clostridioides difficile]
MSPVIKITGNSDTYNKMPDNIDINAAIWWSTAEGSNC